MKRLFLLTALFIYFFKTGYTQPGSADTSFGKNGIVATDFGLVDNHYPVTSKGLLLASDSGVYVILEGNGFACIAKRLSNGAVDLHFGINGFSGPAAIINATAAFDTAGNIIMVGGSPSVYGTPVVIKYNRDGTVKSQFSIAIYDFHPFCLAIQKDGKIVIAGFDSPARYTIVRYNPDGTLDNTFSEDGQTSSDFRSISAISLQADNKLVVAGQFGSIPNLPGSDFAVARYNSNGSPDSSFGSNGKQTTTFGFGSIATTLALKNDGKIVAAGFSYNNYNNEVDYILNCYNTNGSLDSTFSEDGKMIVSLPVSSIAIQKNGKIVTAGSSEDLSLADNIELTRYNTNGTLDNTFNGNGKQIIDFGSRDIARAVAIRSDGKIVVSGNNINDSYNSDFFEIARYNSTGSPDNTFDTDGKLKDSLHFNQGSTYYTATKVQSDGKPVAAGYTFNGKDYDFAIARYNTDGSLDKSFSFDGRQTTDFGSGNDYASSLAIQNDGKIVVVGFANGSFAIARYNTDGSPDSTFAGNGKPKTELGPATSIVIQNDGKILVACSGFTIIRYNSNGSADSSFGDNGTLTTYFGGVNKIHQIALQNDGKIVAAGVSIFYYERTEPDYYLAVARYNADGIPDNTFSEDGKLLSLTNESDAYNSVVIQSDNKIITGQHVNGTIYLTRYNVDGSNDNTFGNNGTVSYYANFGHSSTKPYNIISYPVILQNDNKIIVGGTNFNNFLLVRFLPDGTVDSSFITNAVTVTEAGFNGEGIQGIAISQNKLYAVGYGSYPDKLGVITRYLLDSNNNNNPPVVTITSPADSTYFIEGTYIKFKATASDTDGTISKVEFYNGDTLLHTEYVAPYGYQLKNAAAGNYTITARATDNDGQVGISAPVHITVVSKNSFNVSIVSPANNEVYATPAYMHLKAEVNNPHGKIARVEFYNGATLLRNEYKYPYTYVWRNVPEGVYYVTAKAIDEQGFVTTSETITIKVIERQTIVSSKPYKENEKTALNDALTLRLSPNPANGILNIQTSGLQSDKPATLSIISVSGIVLKTIRISNSSTQLDVSTLASGVYTIKIISVNEVRYKQFVKL